MPCYRVLCLARPDTTPSKLADIFRSLAKVVYREKGQFRTIENLGVRPLHWPIRAFGHKYDDARWVQFWCDVSPAGLTQLRGLIRQEESILMATPLRARAELGETLGDFRPHRREVEKRKHTMPSAPTPVTELLQ
jgi:ribosomal protein S6